jgi:hypothetical protein
MWKFQRGSFQSPIFRTLYALDHTNVYKYYTSLLNNNYNDVTHNLTIVAFKYNTRACKDTTIDIHIPNRPFYVQMLDRNC